MLKNLKKAGFASYVEVIVTAAIFIVASLGIFTTISMIKPQSNDSYRRLEAAYAGKQIIDELRAEVDARMWDNSQSALSVGTIHSRVIGNYLVNYWLVDDPSGVRRLEMEVFYNGT